MHRLIRYSSGWLIATMLATGASWVAIQNLVTTAALSRPVPVLAGVATGAGTGVSAGGTPPAPATAAADPTAQPRPGSTGSAALEPTESKPSDPDSAEPESSDSDSAGSGSSDSGSSDSGSAGSGSSGSAVPDPARTVSDPDRPPVYEAAPEAGPAPGDAAEGTEAQGYSMVGGQIVLELGPDSVELVSAVPAAGFRTETWQTEYWLRVDFIGPERRSSLMASWYQQAPVIQQTEF